MSRSGETMSRRFMLAWSLLAVPGTHAVTLHVCPSGSDDRGDGTAANPLSGLERARDAGAQSQGESRLGGR